MADPPKTWHIDPLTLREVLDDPVAVSASLPTAEPVERVWLLILLRRFEEAIAAGAELLATSADSFRPTMLLALAYQRTGRWADATRLQRAALATVRGRPREAVVRQHIGKRLFDEQRYAEALPEFERALALRVEQRADPELIASSRSAIDRVRELLPESVSPPGGLTTRGACG